MKRKLLTAILALFLPLVSAGQQNHSAFLLTSGPNADPATLVCNIDDDHVCSSFTLSGTHYIGVMDITGFTAGTPVTPIAVSNWSTAANWDSLAFTDMQYHYYYTHNVLYSGSYCSKGVIGIFPVNIVSYTVSTVYLFSIKEVDTVLNMVAYTDDITGNLRVAAIGRKYTSGVTQDYLIDIPNFTFWMPSVPYRMTELAGETIDEILLTGKHVVLVGRESDAVHNSLCYRVTEASNVTDSPALRYVYRHPGIGGSISGQVRATATETKEFAVAYMHGDDTVKMLTLAINPADEVVLTGVQKSTASNELKAMAYHPDKQLLSLLWPGAYFTTFSRFLLMRPYGTAPYATGEVLSGRIECHSLDDVGGIGFVSAGANGVTVQRVDDISPFPSCHNVFTTTVLPASVPRIEQDEIGEDVLDKVVPKENFVMTGLSQISVICNQ